MGLLKTKSSLGLKLADVAWSSAVLAPLVVTYWRGTWDLLDDLVYPDPAKEPSSDDSSPGTWYRQLTGITCYCLGLFVRIALDLAQYHLKECVEARTRWVRTLLSWLYTALYAMAGVSFWRGIWTLMTRDIGLGPAQLLVILAMSLVLVIVMRAGRSLLSVPLVISVDTPETVWANGNYFKKTPADGGWFVLDVLFTNLVMRHLVVFSWWSLWELENKFLQPKLIGEKDTYVAVDSLLMGYAGFLVTYALDQLGSSLTKRSTKLYISRGLTVATVLMGWFSTVNVWRGVWSMLDHYFLPAMDQDENYAISHLVSLALLSLAMVTTSISNDGIVLDTQADEVISIRYWGKFSKNDENPDEMVPIVE